MSKSKSERCYECAGEIVWILKGDHLHSPPGTIKVDEHGALDSRYFCNRWCVLRWIAGGKVVELRV